MKIHLPAEYRATVQILDTLPGQPSSLVSPFPSFAFNINVCTQGHRDVGDNNLCLVLVAGHFEGGALALHEPGLVVELGNGDWAAFQSNLTTHYNLHYSGKRASFVLQGDKDFNRWLQERNGWKNNQFYC